MTKSLTSLAALLAALSLTACASTDMAVEETMEAPAKEAMTAPEKLEAPIDDMAVEEEVVDEFVEEDEEPIYK